MQTIPFPANGFQLHHEVHELLENEAPLDSDLYEELRKTRASLAQEQGGVPHYLIFPDETLKAFARLKPNSIENARRIRGVGEVKAVKYMGPFLSAIREYESRKAEPRMPI